MAASSWRNVSRLQLGSWLTRASSSQGAMRAVLQEQLDAIKAAGTYKSERVISSPQGAKIRVKGSSSGLLNFCANNYLGLSVS